MIIHIIVIIHHVPPPTSVGGCTTLRYETLLTKLVEKCLACPGNIHEQCPVQPCINYLNNYDFVYQSD